MTIEDRCACGCGEPRSRTARYAEFGHDAKHRSRLYRAVLKGDITEDEARAEIGPYPLADQLSNDLAKAAGRSPAPQGYEALPNHSVRVLADELGVPQKTLRRWMRRQNWRAAVDHGQPWVISPEQAQILRERFRESSRDPEDDLTTSLGDPNSHATVGELLTSYRNILASIKISTASNTDTSARVGV